jgi:hypothetical protein
MELFVKILKMHAKYWKMGYFNFIATERQENSLEALESACSLDISGRLY